MTAVASGSFGGGGLEAGEAVHRDHVHGVAPGLVAVGEPVLERLLGAALDHVEQPGGTGAITDGGEIDDHGDVLVPAAGVAPHVLVYPDRVDTVEAVLVVDQHPLAFGQDSVVGSVPRDPESLGDPGHGQVLHTIASSAHRSPRRDSFARGSAARLVSWRHT